ncbi:MAG: class I SAM-dependent methyltransferase [Stenomitos rutilans HA7619-LM2]|jgi:O-methyltransferase involved in polyketide biosynthesis|nr:class I SAM-dependent methyltransferase [Stenomitos rutilans HA7619-LM2]
MKVENVPEDLFSPVYFRAKETQRPNGIIKDSLAVKIVEQMSPNCLVVDDWAIQFGIAIHTLIVDDIVKQFLQQHPNAAIVILGGGLATRPLLMDNNRAEWFCVDAPYVELFWSQLVGESQRNHFIASVVTDLSWMNQISEAGRAVLFVAEGIFLYLTEAEVKQVIFSLQQRFPNSEIVIEVIGKFILKSTQFFRSKAVPGGRFQWGINDCSEMETWSSGIKLIKEYFCYDYYKERQGIMRFLPYLVGGKQKLLKVAHFRLFK